MLMNRLSARRCCVSALSLLKYIFRRRELAARLEEFFTIYRPLFSGTRWDFLWVALKYLTSTVPRLPRERLQVALATVFTEQEGVIKHSAEGAHSSAA
jgi:hypothetical protein